MSPGTWCARNHVPGDMVVQKDVSFINNNVYVLLKLIVLASARACSHALLCGALVSTPMLASARARRQLRLIPLIGALAPKAVLACTRARSHLRLRGALVPKAVLASGRARSQLRLPMPSCAQPLAPAPGPAVTSGFVVPRPHQQPCPEAYSSYGRPGAQSSSRLQPRPDSPPSSWCPRAQSRACQHP